MQNRTIQSLSLVLLLVLGLGLSLAIANHAQAGIADHAVVNEIHIDGQSGAGGTEDDWVELFNPTASDLDLAGWSIQKMTQSGGTITREALSGTIPAGGYFLIVRDGAATTQTLKDSADLLVSDSFSLAANNSVFLVDDNTDITDSSDPNIVDFVGYGTALNFEGTSTASNIPDERSLSRVPDGEDTDENSVDLQVLSTPTPQNSGAGGGNDVSGTVLVTITPDSTSVQNISPISADIVFEVNSDGQAIVNYGLDSSYGQQSASTTIVENTSTTISLTGLSCGTIYHYSIHAENSDQSDSDGTADASFETLPCGISLNSLTMTKASARANDDFADGWEWEFDITVWDLSETTLKMKFSQWTGAGTLDAGGNMRFSVNGADWFDITENDAYPSLGADLTGLDEDAGAAGRQVLIAVQMKVPVGTSAGDYDSSWGILTE